MAETASAVREAYVKAPGKIILHGEHAVVHGKTAIAASLDLCAYCHVVGVPTAEVTLYLPDIGAAHEKVDVCWALDELQPLAAFRDDEKHIPCAGKQAVIDELVLRLAHGSPPAAKSACATFLHLYSAILCDASTTPAVHVQVLSTLPIGAGLGSSAAFSVSLCAALLFASRQIEPPRLGERCGDDDLATINDWSYQAERMIHGNPSGIDNTVSCFGGLQKLFERKPYPIPRAPQLRVMLVNTTVPRSTKLLVAGVGERLASMPSVMNSLFDAIEAVSRESENACNALYLLQQPDAPDAAEIRSVERKIESLIGINHSLLNCIGVGHPQLDLVCRLAAAAGLQAKLTGAGGGGCAFVLVPGGTAEETVHELRVRLEEEGMQVWDASVGGPGVMAMAGFEEGIASRMKILA